MPSGLPVSAMVAFACFLERFADDLIAPCVMDFQCSLNAGTERLMPQSRKAMMIASVENPLAIRASICGRRRSIAIRTDRTLGPFCANSSSFKAAASTVSTG